MRGFGTLVVWLIIAKILFLGRLGLFFCWDNKAFPDVSALLIFQDE